VDPKSVGLSGKHRATPTGRQRPTPKTKFHPPAPDTNLLPSALRACTHWCKRTNVHRCAFKILKKLLKKWKCYVKKVRRIPELRKQCCERRLSSVRVRQSKRLPRRLRCWAMSASLRSRVPAPASERGLLARTYSGHLRTGLARNKTRSSPALVARRERDTSKVVSILEPRPRWYGPFATSACAGIILRRDARRWHGTASERLVRSSPP
jgi:hypothetical protein